MTTFYISRLSIFFATQNAKQKISYWMTLAHTTLF